MSLRERRQRLLENLRKAGGASPARQSTSPKAAGRDSTADDGTDLVAAAVGDEAMRPLEQILGLPEHLEGMKAEVLNTVNRSFAERHQYGRAGCGRAPWGGAPCQCFVPLLAAIACRFFSCLFCCCCCFKSCGCKQALRYQPPKRLRIGCFWLEIRTQLQERLIQGLFSSFMYCVVYGISIHLIWENFDESCGSGKDALAQVKDCILELARKSIALMVMMCYMPSLMICLYYVDRLDAVMDTIKTMWALEDIQRTVRTFNHQMEEVNEQVLLLSAIEDRVMKRTSLVMSFGQRVASLAAERRSAIRAEGLRTATSGAVDCLELMALELKPASIWLSMSADERKAAAEQSKQTADALFRRNFELSSENSTIELHHRQDTSFSSSIPDAPTATFTLPDGRASAASVVADVTFLEPRGSKR